MCLLSVYSRLFGQYVGRDILGNRYYTSQQKQVNREKRWVCYVDSNEPSKIPVEWSSWLNYQMITPPSENKILLYDWLKPRYNNLIGMTNMKNNNRIKDV